MLHRNIPKFIAFKSRSPCYCRSTAWGLLLTNILPTVNRLQTSFLLVHLERPNTYSPPRIYCVLIFFTVQLCSTMSFRLRSSESAPGGYLWLTNPTGGAVQCALDWVKPISQLYCANKTGAHRRAQNLGHDDD